MKYCIVGPPLFGKTLSKSESWTKQFEYFEKILIPAYKERGCTNMIIAGPIFETKQKIEWTMLTRFKKLLEGIEVWYLPRFAKEPFLELFNNINVYTEPFKMDDIIFIPYMNNEKFMSFFNKLNNYEKMITNADTTGVAMTEKDICISNSDKHYSNGIVLNSPYMLDPELDQNRIMFYDSVTKEEEFLLNVFSRKTVRMKIETLEQIEELENLNDSTIDFELEVNAELVKDPKIKKKVKALMLKQGIKRLVIEQDDKFKNEEIILDLSNLFDISKMKKDIIIQITNKTKSDKTKVSEILNQVFNATMK
jgi:hypothetical protein